MPQTDVTTLIGNTPIVRLTQFDTGPCELYVKLETQNPGGSIKDRIGLSMIEAAERDGHLGGEKRHLIEATAGNTGLSLALVAAQRGYKMTIVIPDKMSAEKIFHLRALGAEVIMTRSDVAKGHPEYYQDLAKRISEEKGIFYVNQFANPANPLAHETQTGPEIFRQMNGEVDAVVAGVGSGGTLTGLSRFFAKAKPDCEMVLADPKGSILKDYIDTGTFGAAGSWVVEGIGEDFIPDICDLSRVKKAYTISDSESLLTARELLKRAAILGGSSSGTLLAAALRYCREQTTKKKVVTFVCDSGNKYLSKMFNDYWMLDHRRPPRSHWAQAPRSGGRHGGTDRHPPDRPRPDEALRREPATGDGKWEDCRHCRRERSPLGEHHRSEEFLEAGAGSHGDRAYDRRCEDQGGRPPPDLRGGARPDRR
jgi:cystathionine beta-synthase